MAVVLALLFAGCTQWDAPGGQRADELARVPFAGANLTEACVDHFEPGRDYFPDKLVVDVARHFTLSYHGHYKVVRATVERGQVESAAEPAAWGDIFDVRLVLVQCGTPVPALEGNLAGAVVVEVPVRTVATNYDDEAIRLRELGLADRLVAIGGGGIYDPDLRSRWERRELASIGYTWDGTPNREVLLALRPDLTLLRTASLEHGAGLRKTREMGLDAVPTFSWAEPTYLGRAEWLKFTAVFLNAEGIAHERFTSIRDSVEALRAQVDTVARRPTAVWASSGGGGRWQVMRNSIEADMLRDAGAVNLFDDPASAAARMIETGYQPTVAVNAETFLRTAGRAEYWFTGNSTTETWPTGSFLRNIPAYRERRVFHHRNRARPEHGADDWYETANVRPDLVLRDLIAILHPHLRTEVKPMFFGRVEPWGGDGGS